MSTNIKTTIGGQVTIYNSHIMQLQGSKIKGMNTTMPIPKAKIFNYKIDLKYQ